MLLSEKKVWDVVNGKIPRPKVIEDILLRNRKRSKTQTKEDSKEIMEWDEKNEEALRVISFTVIDRLQDLYTMRSRQKMPGTSYAKYTPSMTSRENIP